MIPRRTTQQGMGFTSALLLITVVIFFATLFFKMAPSYFKFWQVQSAMESAQKQPNIVSQGPRGIIEAVAKQLYIDDVRSVDAKDFKVEKSRDGSGFTLVVDYQDQVHLFFNVDVLMSFKHAVLFSNP